MDDRDTYRTKSELLGDLTGKRGMKTEGCTYIHI